MAGFNYAQNIIGIKKGTNDIHELELEVAQLSASVLEIKGDIPTNTNQLTNGAGFITALNLNAGIIGSGEKIIDKLVNSDLPTGASLWFCQSADDSPDVGNFGAVLIIKATPSGAYSRLYAFVGGSLYSSTTGQTIPASLTWAKISTL